MPAETLTRSEMIARLDAMGLAYAKLTAHHNGQFTVKLDNTQARRKDADGRDGYLYALQDESEAYEAFKTAWASVTQSKAIVDKVTSHNATSRGCMYYAITFRPWLRPEPAPKAEPVAEPEPAPLAPGKFYTDAIKLTDGRTDTGAFHRAIEVARALRNADLWDGQSTLHLYNAYGLHTRLYGIAHEPASDLQPGIDYIIEGTRVYTDLDTPLDLTKRRPDGLRGIYAKAGTEGVILGAGTWHGDALSYPMALVQFDGYPEYRIWLTAKNGEYKIVEPAAPAGPEMPSDEEIVRGLEPEIRKAAAAAWETHPNNPKNLTASTTTRARVGTGKAVHAVSPYGRRPVCGAGESSGAHNFRRARLHPVPDTEPITCKSCLKALGDDTPKN